MARNGSGAFSTPNTFVSGTVIPASSFNANFSDIASEITNSLALDGQSVMTGQFKAANGTLGAPSITFGSDLDSGFYRIGADSIGLGLGGALVVTYSATGVAITGTLSATGAGTIGGALTVTGAITATGGFTGTVSTTDSSAGFVAHEGISTEAGAAAGPILSLYRNSASPAASDVIGAVNFYGKDSGGNKTLYGQNTVAITDTTDGSEDADWYALAMVGGTLTTVLKSTGADISVPGALAVTGNVSGAAGTFTGALSGATAAGAMVATQANMETASATSLLTSPGRQHFHPGHIKAWSCFDQVGSHDIAESWNVTSISDAGVGQSTINWAITFNAVTYGWFGSARDSDAGGDATMGAKSGGTKSTTQLQIIIADAGATNFDSPEVTVAAVGDLP